MSIAKVKLKTVTTITRDTDSPVNQSKLETNNVTDRQSVCQARRDCFLVLHLTVGGAVASWLVRSTPERVVRVRVLAGDIVLCSWARHLTLTVPLFTQVYKWVPVNLMLGVTLRWTSIPSRGEQKYSWSLHAKKTEISFRQSGGNCSRHGKS